MEEVREEELTASEAIYYDSVSKINDNSFRVRIDPDVEEEIGSDAPPAFSLEFLLPQGYPDVISKFALNNIRSKYQQVPGGRQGCHFGRSSSSGGGTRKVRACAITWWTG